MAFITTEIFDDYNIDEGTIVSKNNLTLCDANYFETCWCKFNSSEPLICPYLLHHVKSFSNSSYFCVYHIIRRQIDCYNTSHIFPKSFVSNFYIYLTILLFIIGLIGNGISVIILLSTKLRRLNIYRNLTILCILNILYLISTLVRHENIYEQDLRDISVQFCRLHTFTIAFIGHLCSWQLVSTSIQRVHALLSLQSHRTTSWVQTWSILLLCIIIPLFIFDGQLLFNYGILRKKHVCDEILNDIGKQFQRARKYPINILKFSNNISLNYYPNFIPNQPQKIDKEDICMLWNILDTFIYAIIPFIIILICSLIIIVKVCQRRRSTVVLGGICHTNREFMVSPRDHLSTLLITTNILFILMTGPLNICLIIQSVFECFFRTSSPIKIFPCLIESLRLLQTSYHALSFLFYCVIGNKFRSSAKSICRTIYCQFIEYGIADRCAETPLVSCCFDRRRSSSSGQTLSTNSRLTIDQRPTVSIPMNVIRRPTYITYDINQKTTTQLYKCEKV